MATIQGIYAREILDSRGIPTIECTLWLDNGGIVATSVPTGTSIGKYEAKELRDNDINRMLGKGVTTAANYINTYIAPLLVGKDPTTQDEIDGLLIQQDGTNNKAKLGANTTLAVSQAVMKGGALSMNIPLYYYIQQKYQTVTEVMIPTCIYALINGGEHGADNLDIQEFQIVPASHIAYEESLNMAVTLFHKLEEVLAIKGAIHSVGLVGGFTPNLYSNSDVFEILVETIKATPYTFTQDLFFGIDVAAEQLYRNGHYTLKDRSTPFSGKELLEYYKKIRDMYNVFLIEDPFQEDDLDMWKAITTELGETTKIVGDSFLVTSQEKVANAIEKKLCNAVLIKPNQVGTITETVKVIKLAKQSNWQSIMSHRSGETNDDFIVDFAVGIGTEYVKFGPPNRGERVAKYNRLSQISFEINQAKKQQLQAGAQPAQLK
ncbi:MAG: phosphopyruvate hydratase [Candidatus Pacebacteria bacterium CG_4_10_14_0_8_um_filter_43_12]|nr:MAG: phosphopyruvate hydratase [Candidatus Pacebacteria bacterium CG10_big_fil_rev_8_21_14_0_10_44_11]PIY79824.1 MAG: phosphopyruvate hydratase [Candidatus Pacebacteria bacterium CG_4_10_14_0_8_um_filter_43_12]